MAGLLSVAASFVGRQSAKGSPARAIMRAMAEREPPTWTRPAEALRVVAYPPHLSKTIRIALIVGTVLFAINQLDVVWRGHADAITWVKVGITYCVPFVVSNIGVLIASRRE
jgi:hypothetical protein